MRFDQRRPRHVLIKQVLFEWHQCPVPNQQDGFGGLHIAILPSFSSIAYRASPHWFCQWCTARRHIGFASGVRVLMQSGFTPPCAVLLHVRRHMVSPVVLGHLGVLQRRR